MIGDTDHRDPVRMPFRDEPFEVGEPVKIVTFVESIYFVDRHAEIGGGEIAQMMEAHRSDRETFIGIGA